MKDFSEVVGTFELLKFRNFSVNHNGLDFFQTIGIFYFNLIFIFILRVPPSRYLSEYIIILFRQDVQWVITH